MTNIEQLNTRIQTIKTNRERLQSEYKKNAAIISGKQKEIKRIDAALRENQTQIDALVSIPTNTTGARQRTPDEQSRLNDYRAARALAIGNKTRIEGEITALQTAQTARSADIVRLKTEKKAEQGLRNNQEKLGPEKKAPFWKRGWRSFKESVPTKHQAPTLAAAAAILAAGIYYGSQNMSEINNLFNRGKSKPRTERETKRPETPKEKIVDEEKPVVEEPSTTADYNDGVEKPKERHKRENKNENRINVGLDESMLDEGILIKDGQIYQEYHGSLNPVDRDTKQTKPGFIYYKNNWYYNADH